MNHQDLSRRLISQSPTNITDSLTRQPVNSRSILKAQHIHMSTKEYGIIETPSDPSFKNDVFDILKTNFPFIAIYAEKTLDMKSEEREMMINHLLKSNRQMEQIEYMTEGKKYKERNISPSQINQLVNMSSEIREKYRNKYKTLLRKIHQLPPQFQDRFDEEYDAFHKFTEHSNEYEKFKILCENIVEPKHCNILHCETINLQTIQNILCTNPPKTIIYNKNFYTLPEEEICCTALNLAYGLPLNTHWTFQVDGSYVHCTTKYKIPEIVKVVGKMVETHMIEKRKPVQKHTLFIMTMLVLSLFAFLLPQFQQEQKNPIYIKTTGIFDSKPGTPEFERRKQLAIDLANAREIKNPYIVLE